MILLATVLAVAALTAPGTAAIETAPAKFNEGISGCSKCCSDSWMKDLGFYGMEGGFVAVVGGRGDGTPRPNEELVRDLSEEGAIARARRVIVFLREIDQGTERLGPTIDRAGFDAFRKAVLYLALVVDTIPPFSPCRVGDREVGGREKGGVRDRLAAVLVFEPVLPGAAMDTRRHDHLEPCAP